MSDPETGVPETPPGAAEPPKRRLWPKILIAAAALLVVVVGAGAAYLYSIDRSVTKNITRADDLPSDTPSGSGQPPRPTRNTRLTGTLNFVLLGSDSRDKSNAGKGRSDSIMVVHLNDARDKAYVISFPRDMYVPVPGHGKNKINAAFSYGGAKLTVSTLENLLGVRMDHLALIDFQGFIKLTDDLGGVTVKNAHAFKSHGYTYPKGNLTIKGKQALWFVRERHALPGGDLDRAKNQRNVIKAILDKGLSASTMADPVRYLKFVSGIAQHLTVDSSLSNAEIRSTALSVHLSSADIKLLQAPISGFATIGGQSVDRVDGSKLKELSAALKNDKVDGYVKKYPKG